VNHGDADAEHMQSGHSIYKGMGLIGIIFDNDRWKKAGFDMLNVLLNLGRCRGGGLRNGTRHSETNEHGKGEMSQG
jgi:hypothetical protein